METGMYVIIYTMSAFSILGIIGLIVIHFMKKADEKEAEQKLKQAV
jgi:hypothetical protein